MGNRIDYYCPSCGEEVWAYSGFEGNTCWGCKRTKTFSNKGDWFTVINHGIKLGYDLQDWYQNDNRLQVQLTSGKKITFNNVLPKSRWKNLSNYLKESQESYTCGLNVINMALAIWGYDYQMKLSEYSYKYFLNAKWGMSDSKFYDFNVKKVFKYCGYTYCENFVGGINFKWNYIDNNDYTKYSIIALGGYGLGGHYFLIIGVDQISKYYLITDQNEKCWIIDTKIMRTAAIYSNNGYLQHSLYKVG